MAEVVSIPKKLLKKGELVILPRKDYEEFLSIKKQFSKLEQMHHVDSEGSYRPAFVRKILKRTKERALHKFTDRTSFLKQVYARK